MRNVVAVETRDDHPAWVDGLVADPFGQAVTSKGDVRALTGDLVGQSCRVLDEDEGSETVAVFGFEPTRGLGHRRSPAFFVGEEDEELLGLRRGVQQGADGVRDDWVGLVICSHDDRVEQSRRTHDRARIGADLRDQGCMVGSTESAARVCQGGTSVHGAFQVGESGGPVDAGAAAIPEEPTGDVDGAEHCADEHQPDDGEHIDRSEHRIDEREDEHEADRSEADRRRQSFEEPVGGSPLPGGKLEVCGWKNGFGASSESSRDPWTCRVCFDGGDWFAVRSHSLDPGCPGWTAVCLQMQVR